MEDLSTYHKRQIGQNLRPSQVLATMEVNPESPESDSGNMRHNPEGGCREEEEKSK